MEMTIKDYINNPMGKQNSVISNRDMYRTHYMAKLNVLMVRENGKIDYTLYKSKNNYYIHLKIPSETVKEFYYDVVIMFYPKTSGSKSLEDYYAKFYTNDPSFVYTFAHAFAKNNLFIEDLKSKMSKQALRKNADIKNPSNEVGYVKTIYFAYLYMKDHGLFNTIHYVGAKKYDKNELLSNIMDADEKIRLRQEEGRIATKKKKLDQIPAHVRKNYNIAKDGSLEVKSTKTVSNIRNIGKTKIIKSTKNSKRV